MNKQDVFHILERMPDEIDVDQLIYALYLRRKLQSAEADLAAGRVVTHEEVEREMKEWRD